MCKPLDINSDINYILQHDRGVKYELFATNGTIYTGISGDMI